MIKLSTMVRYIPKVCNQPSSGSYRPFDNASFFKSLKFGVFQGFYPPKEDPASDPTSDAFISQVTGQVAGQLEAAIGKKIELALAAAEDLRRVSLWPGGKGRAFLFWER